jgi:signal transduction histidine kinase
MRTSLRLKVALALFAAAIVLLAAQAIGVRTLAEEHEARLIHAIIKDDMRNVLACYRDDPAFIPPLNPQLGGYLSFENGKPIPLPMSVATMKEGEHEIVFNGHEIHVAIARFGDGKIIRAYDYSDYETLYKEGLDALMLVTVVFVLPAIWLSYWLSGLLVRQVGGLAKQVQALRSGAASSIDPRVYDEREVAELAGAVNDYHSRMAAMIEREKEFTANVSHELRTPLTRIRTSCELLEPNVAGIDAKSRQRLLQIEQAAEDMHALVDCLLALAREEPGAVQEAVRLAVVVDAILARFAERLEAQSVLAVVDVPAEVRIPADASALGIVLSNLVDNALRHTRSGELRVRYRDGSFSVEDTGTGIAADALPHVFDRFYRAPGGGPDGFGIGLAIVRKICDRHGWQIAVDSQEGVGTRVTLDLKLHENFTNS